MGFVIGFVGLMIVLGPERLSGFSAQSDALKGEIAILLGCVCYAVHGLFARRIPFHGPAEQATAVCLAAGSDGSRLRDRHRSNRPSGRAMDRLCRRPRPWHPADRARDLDDVSHHAHRRRELSSPIPTIWFQFMRWASAPLTLGETLDWNVAAGLALIIAGIAASRFAPSRRKGKT